LSTFQVRISSGTANESAATSYESATIRRNDNAVTRIVDPIDGSAASLEAPDDDICFLSVEFFVFKTSLGSGPI
jgi:hypothetical protein